MGKLTLGNYIIASFFAVATLAQGATLTEQDATTQTAFKNYSASFSSGITSNLFKTSTPEHQLSSDFNLSVALKPTKEDSVSFGLAATKDLKGEREFAFSDGSLGYSRRLYRTPEYSLSGSIAAILPMSESSREIQKLNTGLVIAPSISSSLGIDSFSAQLRPSLRYNFHSMKTNMLGGSNTEYSLGARLTLGYNLTDELSLSAVSSYARNTTYYGNSIDSYSFIQALGYQATDELALELGHANGGNALAPNGVDTDINFYNDNTSTIYFALTLSL